MQQNGDVRGRVSRRSLLKAGVWSAVGLAGLQALACSPTTPAVPAAPAPGGQTSGDKAPKAGGVFNVAYLREFDTIDPHNQYNVHATGLIYNGLLIYKNDLQRQSEIEGDLAEKWEQTDEKTYVFKLIPGVKFQNVKPLNGRELTSADIKYSFERITKPNDPLKFYRDLYPFDRIETPDATTVRFILKAPYSPFMSFVALPFAVIVPKELDDIKGGQPLVDVGVGTGPFIIKEFNAATGLTFEKNPNYFKKGLPYLDGVKYVVMADKTAMFNAFRTGALDVTPQLLPHLITYPQVKIIETQMADKAKVQFAPSLLWNSIRYNLAKKPFDDIRVRKALTLAIDRDQLIATTNEGKASIIGPLPGGIGQSALPEAELRRHELYKPDIAKAKQLLAEAGYPNGFKTEGLISATGGGGPNMDDALFIKDQWAKIGVDTAIKPIEGSNPWYAEMAKSAFEWTVFSHSGYFDPDDYFVTYYKTGAVRNYGAINDPKANDLIDKQRITSNEADRKKITDELQRHLIDQIYFTYLYARQFPVGVQNYVKNYFQNSIPFASHRHWDKLWLDK